MDPRIRLCLPLLLCLIGVAPAALAAEGAPALEIERPDFSADPGNDVLTSTSSSAAFYRESAGPDTFAIYGGPTRGKEGKFETDSGAPDWQGWYGVDRTEKKNFWQVSSFNAENLGGHGVGNRAYWCGLDTDQVDAWATPPGYGNNWSTALLFESAPVADPSAGQTVSLDFFFNHDLEPDWDFFTVAYDSAGIWLNVLRVDGTNKFGGAFPSPGVQFQAVATRSITYAGGDYSSDGTIKIRLLVSTDSGWSDEDGLYPSDGAVQIDDVSITTSDATYFENFEGPGPYLLEPLRLPIWGDFSDVHAYLTDLDPCVDNGSGAIAFIDYGQDVPNGPGPNGESSTGGSLSANWHYGMPGGWVVNYTYGLASDSPAGIGSLPRNEVWSPEIEWDLPGTEDDALEFIGAKLRFSGYFHNPLFNGICWVWGIRSRSADGPWSSWRSRNFFYYSELPRWQNIVHDVTNLLVPQPTHVQISLGIVDAAAHFGVPGSDATPAPYFDNVALYKYRVGGPALSTQTIHLANDGFPQSGLIDASTPAARDALDVRFDMARDLSFSSQVIAPGDSVIVDVKAVLPGTTVADMRMKWALRRNTFFDDVRSAPNRAKDENVDTTGPIWTGEVVADTSRSYGFVVANRFFADLPDVDFLYPGDRLQYYFEATDDGGRTTTLPADIRGFGEWHEQGRSIYNRIWTMRCLPSIVDADGTQPSKLIYIDSTETAGNPLDQENEVLLAMGQLGLVEGVDYDVYVVQGSSSFLSNGIGSAGAHGATAAQLSGYDTIVVLFGNRSYLLLSNGTNVGTNDKGDDIGTLEDWKALPGQRNTVYFGDYVASGMSADSVDGAVYVQTTMGVDLNDSDVRNEIGDQSAPGVAGLLPAFDTVFTAYGGCPTNNRFDSISPRTGAVAGHAWVSAGGTNYATPAASVVFDRLVSGHRKVDITFPFGFAQVYGAANDGLPSRARLLEQVFGYFGVMSSGSQVTSAPLPHVLELSVAPNPFNPRTEIRFRAKADAPVRIVAHDLRGRRVAVLFEGQADGLEQHVVWDATEQASGVYLVRIEAEERTLTQKVALVR